MKDKDIANAAKKLIDAPYCLGKTPSPGLWPPSPAGRGAGGGGGFDCLTMLWEFYGNLGVYLPREFKGISEGDYKENWERRRLEACAVMLEYLQSIGKPMDVNYAVAGDLMIFEGEWVFPGIYLGSGNVLCAFERGVKVIPLKFLKGSLMEVRRCLETQAH